MVFPDSEALVIAYLKPSFVGWRVATRIPADVPELFLHVRRTGGPALNRVVDQPQMTITAWGKLGDTVTPSQAASQARELILNCASSTGIRLARNVNEFSGPYVDDDPETGRPRYTFTVALRIRAPRTED